MSRGSSPLPIVDAHQHFWNLQENRHPWLQDDPPIPFRYGDYRALRRNYLPADYRRDFGSHQVLQSVYVETEWDPQDPIGETRWVEALADRHGLPNAIVAQAWLHHPDAGEVLRAQAAFPRVRSVRHKPAGVPEPGLVRPDAPPLAGSMSDPAWRAGYAHLARHGLSFDLQTPYWHLPEAAALAADFPRTTLILNHTGLPVDRSPAGVRAWRGAMETLAGQPNTAVKISGLGLPGRPWRVSDNGPLVLDAIAIFGVERCMFASNFPVDGLVAGFDAIFSGFKEIVGHLPRVKQEALFHDNALRFYGIPR